MTSRGRALLGLGLLTYIAARAFGSKPLYPVALGLLLAPLLAWLWVRLAQGPMQLRRRIGADARTEADPVPVRFCPKHKAYLPPGSFLPVKNVSRLGEPHTRLDTSR